MNNQRNRCPIWAMTLLSLAGTAALAGCALAQATSTPPQTTTADGAAFGRIELRSSEWMRDREVVNNNGEAIASVSDLIVNRGTGRIDYVIITTGATLGMGGRSVAIPFSSFGWTAAANNDRKDRLLLAATPEQLAQYPEFTHESWKKMKEPLSRDQGSLHQRLRADTASEIDPYSGQLDTSTGTIVTGEIVGVERVRTTTFGEQVEIDVKAADGSNHRIALGPSWYVNGAQAAPMRGDKVVVDVIALPRDPSMLVVATRVRTGNRELRLRDGAGTPTWAIKTTGADGREHSTISSRWLLESELRGMKIDCRGEAAGKVHQIIVDRLSGEIAFLSIDPNQNFLGIGDTKRLVPWTVATVTLEGVVRIDASKEMVLASPETPDDLATFSGDARTQSVYDAFGVKRPNFSAAHAIPNGALATGDAWSAGGPIIMAIDAASTKTLDGRVVQVSEVTFADGSPPARSIRLRVAGTQGEDQVILLGPAWYMDQQKDTCRSGDEVKVEASRTTIDGRSFWLARSIECKQVRQVLIDANNAPVWRRR